MNLQFIKDYAKSLARRTNYGDVEEIVSEALLAYVKASHNLKKLHVINPDAYVQKWITGACKSFMRKHHSTQELKEDSAIYKADYIKELIEAMKLTDIEEKILQFRLQGYVDHEIAKEINMTQQGVQKVRSRIGKKFQEFVCSK